MQKTVVQDMNSKIDHYLSHYHVPAVTDKKIVFQKILAKIEEGNSTNQGDGKTFFLSPVYRIAISTAAFLLVFFLLHFFLSTVVVKSENLTVNSYKLPDESKVILDQKSEISYPRYWWKREVNLLGSGYFDVTEGRKFKVKTQYGDVNVLGTRFQVEILHNGLIINCYEGTVKLSTNKFEKVINKGTSVTLNGTKLENIKTIEEEYPDIARFNQHFSQVNLKFIVEEIEYFFNEKIELKNPELSKHFSGSIQATDCESALNALCKPLNLKFSYNPIKNIYIVEEQE